MTPIEFLKNGIDGDALPAGPPSEAAIRVVKSAFYIPISNELLMDYGLIEDTRPPTPPPSRRTRLRRRWADRARSARTRLGEVIAGRKFENGDDW